MLHPQSRTRSTFNIANVALVIMAFALVCLWHTPQADAKLKFQHQSTDLGALIKQNSKEVVSQASNVNMHYGRNYPGLDMANYTMAYNGTKYVYDANRGSIKLGDKLGDLISTSYLWIKPNSFKHERLINAYAYYSGYVNNPDGDTANPPSVYVSYSWGGGDIVPLAFQKVINGKPYLLTLNSAYAYVLDDRLPMPSLVSNGTKGGGGK